MKHDKIIAKLTEMAETSENEFARIRCLELLGKHLGTWDIERFKHEKELIDLRNKGLSDAVKEIPALAFFEHGVDDDEGSE